MTHGGPTAIVVRVRSPVDAAAPLVLMVQNDGPRPPGPIEPRRNHWGGRNMREYADAVGATIRWERPEAGSTW